MDEHVHARITEGLRLRGVDVLTAQEDGRTGVADDVLLSRATELGRVMFSQDADVLREAALRTRQGLSFGGLAFARQQAITIGQAIRDLELLATASDPQDLKGRVEYLPF
jgi:uncharacterized protein DUF5615